AKLCQEFHRPRAAAAATRLKCFHRSEAGMLTGFVRTEPQRPMLRDASQRRRCEAPQHEGEASIHSITSSARASTIGGTSRPRAFAVLRLITSSYLVRACTGRVAGFCASRL